LEILPQVQFEPTDLALGQHPDIIQKAAEWFKLDVANGDAREDTIKTYLSQVRQWFVWCRDQGVAPAGAKADDLKRYRGSLVDRGAKHSTISLKLTTIRRFYQGAVDRRLLQENPADGIKAPRDRSAYEKTKHLSAGEAELLFRAIPGNELRSLRDRAMLVMMTIEGLRRVEVVRMNVGDMKHLDDPAECKILVRGKGKDSYIFPREETASMLAEYLAARGGMLRDADGEPLFVSIDKGNTPRRRLSRIGLNGIVDKYFVTVGVKREGVSCHALRHTCGHLIYRETKDLRVVQEVLRHSSPATAAKYSDVDSKMNRHTKNISIKITR
jgi:site-specific recombinase XerD